MTRPLNILVLDGGAENADSLAELFAMDNGVMGVFGKPMDLPKVLDAIGRAAA